MTVQRQLHKFGGSSLADAQCYQRVAKILQEHSSEQDLVVVSAAGQTTNQLIQWIQALDKDGRVAHEVLQELRQFQRSLLDELLSEDNAAPLIDLLETEINHLGQMDYIQAEAQRCDVLGHGEVWSSRLLAALLNQLEMKAQQVDARQFLRAERGVLPEVDRGRSLPLLQEILAQQGHQRLVITGFMAQSQDGETILLGRNGSDYSATVIGALADVCRVVIWSDVAGVYSADPRKVTDACLLPLLRLDEANELARLAAPVLHCRTLQPVAQSHIDLSLRCSHKPESGSTRIERVLASGRGAKIVTSHEDILIVTLNLANEHDPKRQLAAIDGILKQAQLQPLAREYQAEQDCLRLAYPREVVDEVIKLFASADLELDVTQEEGFSMIAAVGAGVTNNPNHSYGFNQHLKDAPVEFIEEADSGLSLVAILNLKETAQLVCRIHEQLFQAQKRVAIALCGKGNIGSNWLHLFVDQKSHLERRWGMSFDIIALIDSKSYWLDLDGIDAATALEQFEHHSQAYQDLEWIHLLSEQDAYDEVVVLDVTSSELVAAQYQLIAEQGMHLICANKIAGAGSTKNYLHLKDVFEKSDRHWLYNATVGAGLPVNYALRDLLESGDQITAISGIYSGTLSWLFQQYDGSIPFSELVDLAWQQGLTEPDPRADLDGTDVVRKLVILAREAGLEIEPEAVKVESLVPKSLQDLDTDDFFDNLELLNESLAERLEKAKAEGRVLRYVARLSAQGEASVGVEALNPEHALANLLPCDNIFAIESRWYKDNPLVIRGPGAGREVTAGALQSDLNRLASLL
ncbi:MAG: bifunctional aspartate kinase/homoserine dehydrogenase II [Vibrio sp.]